MRWTPEQYNEWLRKQNQPNPARLRPAVEKHAQGQALDGPVQREEASGQRFEIVFNVYAERPCDWDNYHIKELQDLLVAIGILPSDGWQTLSGKVVPHKCSRADERTEIEITQIK